MSLIKYKNMEGKGISSVMIDKGIFTQTWNNVFSDLLDNTFIETDSRVCTQLLELNKVAQFYLGEIL